MLSPTAAPLVGSGWLVRAVAAADGSLPTGAMFGQAMPASSRPIRQSRINASMLNLPASSSGFVALRVEGLVRIESPEASANAGTAAGAVEFEISGFGPAELRVAGSLVASLSAPTQGAEQIPSTTSGRLTLAPGWHRLELLSLAQTPESLGGTRTISIRMSERTDWSPTLISGNRIGFVRAPADIADSAAVPGSDGRIDDGDYLAFSQAFAAGIAMADIADSDAVPGPDGAVDSGDLTLFFLSFSEQTSP